MDKRITLLLLVLGVSLCFAASGVLRQKRSALRSLAKRGVDNDLCDQIDDGVTPDWMYTCDKGKTCIFADWQCDGDEECKDGSDEDVQKCANIDPESDLCVKITDNGVVPYWMRVCQDQGQCIFASWVCDNENDCLDGSDEAECPLQKIDLCKYKKGDPDWLATCDSGDECILEAHMCDREEDCKDGSDEKFELCEGKWGTGPYDTLGK